MKTLNSYICEKAHTEQENFVAQVSRNNPGSKAGVHNYFSLMYQYGLCMHPDDSWKNCTLKFTDKQCEVLDDFVEKAFEVFGDKVYEIGTEELNKFWKSK